MGKLSHWWRLCGARTQPCRENFNGEQQDTCGKIFLSAFTITRYLLNGMISYITISPFSTLFDKYSLSRKFNPQKFICSRKAHIVSPTVYISVAITWYIEMTYPNLIKRQVTNSSSITSAWIIHSKLKKKQPNSDISTHTTKQRKCRCSSTHS